MPTVWPRFPISCRWKTRGRRTPWCGGRRRCGARCAFRCAAIHASTRGGAGPPRAARDGRRALGLELPGASGQPPHEGAGLVRVAEAHERVEGERRIADPGVAIIPVAPASEGYMGSRPVRVGNAAFDNLQLDIYGELMDSVYLYDKYGSPMGYDAWTNLVRLMDWLSANWHRPDEGIWEVRGGRQEFVFSRMMCWVAFDRAIRLATKRSFPAPLAKWYETRDRIFHDVFTRFWDAGRGAFVQHVGATTVDAATLLMPLVRFISPTDPRWISTLRALEHELVSDSLPLSPRVDSPTGSPARRARSRRAPSGTSSASPVWATCSRRGSSSRRCSATPITWGCTARSSAPRRSISATSRRRLPTWRSSAPPSI